MPDHDPHGCLVRSCRVREAVKHNLEHREEKKAHGDAGDSQEEPPLVAKGVAQDQAGKGHDIQ
jgi:hypothetical protein